MNLIGMYLGKCYFEGSKPSNSTMIGGITFYYNGSFPYSHSNVGGIDYYEFEDDVWVVYGPYYNGHPRVYVTSRRGRVQEGYQ